MQVMSSMHVMQTHTKHASSFCLHALAPANRRVLVQHIKAQPRHNPTKRVTCIHAIKLCTWHDTLQTLNSLGSKSGHADVSEVVSVLRERKNGANTHSDWGSRFWFQVQGFRVWAKAWTWWHHSTGGVSSLAQGRPSTRSRTRPLMRSVSASTQRIHRHVCGLSPKL